MKKILILLLVLVSTITGLAQNELPSIYDVDSSATVNVKIKDPMKPKGMLGIKYSYGISNAFFSQDIETKPGMMPLNLSIAYSTYTDLWDMMNFFGLQMEFRYGQGGFNSKHLGNEKYTVADFSLVSQFHIDIAQRFRVLANIGPFAGYRLKMNREWDKYDNRFDYGLIGGIGFALVTKPMEFHLEGNFRYSLSSYYHPNKLSDEYWLFARPYDILISAGVFIHLF